MNHRVKVLLDGEHVLGLVDGEDFANFQDIIVQTNPKTFEEFEGALP